MHKRDSERIPSNIALRFTCRNKLYSGIIRNFSGNGMYIDTEIDFPIESRLEVLITIKDGTLKVPIEIVRIVKSGNIYDGMGVKLLNSPEKYLELLIKHNIGALS